VTVILRATGGVIIMPTKSTTRGRPRSTRPETNRVIINTYVDPLTAKALKEHKLAAGRLIDVAVALYLKSELESRINRSV
jgi:hypothetical protein